MSLSPVSSVLSPLPTNTSYPVRTEDTTQKVACRYFKEGMRVGPGQRYRILSFLGEGSTAYVWKVLDEEEQTQWALKVAKQCLVHYKQDFTPERVILTECAEMPHIVHFREFFEEENHDCLVLELFDGSLKQLLEERGKGFCEAEVLDFARSLFSGLRDLHEKARRIHTDLSIYNVGGYKESTSLSLFDLGESRTPTEIEKLIDSYPYLTQRYFRAPETLFWPVNVTSASDMWSAGCILAQLFLGEPLFRGAHAIQQIHFIQELLGCPPLDFLTFDEEQVWIICSRKSMGLADDPSEVGSIEYAHYEREGLVFSSRFQEMAPSEEELETFRQNVLAIKEQAPLLFQLLSLFFRWKPEERLTARDAQRVLNELRRLC